MPNKFEKVVFYLFLFCIPFQTRIILQRWILPFNEWMASFVYLTDVLLVALFIFWLVRIIQGKSKFIFAKYDWWLIAFFLVATASAFGAKIIPLSVFRLLKLAEFGLLYFYLKNNFKFFSVDMTAAALISSGVFQSIVVFIQYVKQGSVGLKILGESAVGLNIDNVAVFFADGVKYLRVYGTTPHPNVLAVFLFLCIFTFYFWFYRNSKSLWPLVAYAVILAAFFLTFSRTAIGIWFLASLPILLFGTYRKKFKPVLITTIIVGLVFCILFWPQVKSRAVVSLEEDAVTERVMYNRIAGLTTGQNPLLGVGYGQFVADMMSRLKRYPANFFQPVHNIYLLISSETGIAGILAFLFFLFLLISNFVKEGGLSKRYPILVFFGALLIMGFFDHLFWTLQQGSLVFWLGLTVASGGLD